MRALFERQFVKRGLDARPDLIDWLLARIERSHIAVMRTIDVLDQHVLERRKRLSIPLARSTLREAGLVNEHAADPTETRGTAPSTSPGSTMTTTIRYPARAVAIAFQSSRFRGWRSTHECTRR